MYLPATDCPESPAKNENPIILNSNTANLGLFEINYSNSVSSCTPKFLVVKCKCDPQLVRHTCMSKHCLTCTDALGDRRAQAALDRFVSYKESLKTESRNFMMLYTDFTIPPILRQSFVNPDKWQGLRSKLWEVLREKFGGLFALEATHPVSERAPDRFHPHLNFLWVQRPDYKPFLNVELLSKLFKSLLHYKGVVVLHHSYSDKIEKQKHWIRYVTRIFPYYSVWAGALRWYGKYPRQVKKDKYCCPVCGQAYRVLGFIDADIVKAYDEYGFAVGRSPPWFNDKNITPFKKIKSLFESE
jgi:hypothetical protein